MSPTSVFGRNSQGGIIRNPVLKTSVNAFYHSDYEGGGNWKIQGTIENLICTFKNDITPYPFMTLLYAQTRLKSILNTDLPEILKFTGLSTLCVCVIPRAKEENTYSENQKLFRKTVQETICNLNGFIDGTYFIIRHTNTKTTHLSRHGNGGDGAMPYPGITKDTCTISDEVVGKNILLIDDLYTKTVNIDEDAIQALFDKGAKSVYFYSIGKTVSKY